MGGGAFAVQRDDVAVAGRSPRCDKPHQRPTTMCASTGSLPPGFTRSRRFVARRSASRPRLFPVSAPCAMAAPCPRFPTGPSPEAFATAFRSSMALTCSSLPRRAASPCSLSMLTAWNCEHRTFCGPRSSTSSRRHRTPGQWPTQVSSPEPDFACLPDDGFEQSAEGLVYSFHSFGGHRDRLIDDV